jgi:signal transduction histidine kinase
MDDLLEASRFEADELARDRRIVDLRQVVHDAVDKARARAGLIGAEIASEPSPEPLPVMAQAAQLGRILDNLMNNGLTYSERPARLRVASCREGENAIVRVADNGVGIPDGEAERIFEPFFSQGGPGFPAGPGDRSRAVHQPPAGGVAWREPPARIQPARQWVDVRA